MAAPPWSNWAQTVQWTGAVQKPTTLEELERCVKGASRVFVVGSGHSFHFPAAPPTEGLTSGTILLDLTHGFNKVLSVQPSTEGDRSGTCVVEAGCSLGQLATTLQKQNLALESMPSLMSITIAGAVLTGTHGSGASISVMATLVNEMDVMTASGEVVTIRDPRFFLHVGLLGIVIRLTLRCVPSYSLHQRVYEHIQLQKFLPMAREVVEHVESSSFWIDLGRAEVMAWLRFRIEDMTPTEELDVGGMLRAIPVRVSETNDPVQTQMTGPWLDVLPFFGIGQSLPNRETVQAEFFIPLSEVQQAIEALQAIPDAARHLPHIEVRVVKGDHLALSPCNFRFLTDEKDLFACLHFGFPKNMQTVAMTVNAIERALKPWGSRPHWGKLFTVSGCTLERFCGPAAHRDCAAFWALVLHHDPRGKFRNALIDQVARKVVAVQEFKQLHGALPGRWPFHCRSIDSTALATGTLVLASMAAMVLVFRRKMLASR
ncbi:xyoA [Symbiodinium sp. CCMP2456]|nr:xyoA [Symbiodinium sp. CCMP2456]